MNGLNLITLTFVGQVVTAFLGTAAFSVLFAAPRKHYLNCGLCGMLGWALYYALTAYAGFTPSEATFFGTLLVAMLSHFMAVWFRCPTTVFLITGIFPMVPGGGIYWTIYYLVSGQTAFAKTSGGTAFMVTIAIVAAILIVNEIPSRFFKWVMKPLFVYRETH